MASKPEAVCPSRHFRLYVRPWLHGCAYKKYNDSKGDDLRRLTLRKTACHDNDMEGAHPIGRNIYLGPSDVEGLPLNAKSAKQQSSLAALRNIFTRG